MSTGKKAAVAGVALLGAAFVAYRIYFALMPEETRIRRAILSIRDGFNRGEAGTISSHLADDFSEEASGLGRDEVRLLLVKFFFTERDRSGALRFFVEAPPEGTEVTLLKEDPDSADVAVSARFFTRDSRGSPSPFGTILFTGRSTRKSGEWKILRARHKQIEGRWPF